MIQRGPGTFDPSAVARQTLETPLSTVLASQIRRAGPLTFAEWMQTCLYHPQHGYYRRGKPTVGRDGDFITSPEVHPIFGAAVAHVAIELWRQAGCPSPFRIAEIGPGTGALAESLLRHVHAAAADLPADVRYTLVEPDSTAADRQVERLQAVIEPSQVENVPQIDELALGHHLIVANELLDALPVHRLTFRGGAWQELYVDYSADAGFQEVTGDVSDPTLLQPLTCLRITDQQIVEVGPQRSTVVTALARALGDPGVLLLFDYGYPRDRLYASWRRDGTLMTFRNHVPGDDPYAHTGEQDMTAHVDIDQIREAAQASGLTPLPALSQTEWLQHLGAAVMPAVADAQMETASYLAARRAIETLTEPAGLGRIAVMGFTRGSVGSLPGWSES